MDVWCHQNGENQKYENTWNSESDRDCNEGAGEKDFNGLTTWKDGIKIMLERE